LISEPKNYLYTFLFKGFRGNSDLTTGVPELWRLWRPLV